MSARRLRMECFISGNQRVCESLSERNKCAPCPVSGVCPYVAHVPSSGRRSPSVPMAIPQRSPRNGGWLLPAATPFVFRPILLFFLFLLLATTFVCAKSTAHRPPYTTKAVSASQTNLSPPDVAISRTARHDHDHADSEISHVDDDDEGADDSDSTVPDTATDSTIQDVVVEPDNREETDSEEKSAESSSSSGETVPSIDVTEEEVVEDENDFCRDNYVDSAYFNGYDTILTRGDQLWYYYKEQHKLSKAFDQRRFTQGDHIQGAFNVSRTPRCGRAASFSRSPSSTIGQLDRGDNSQPSSTNSPVSSTLTPTDTADCKEISKMHAMAVYFLHNKERSRSYYNLDVRNLNGTQKRARSRDLPWAMKQVGLLGGNLWPNGWEAYQQHRPVAFLPSRYELIFIINHYHSHEHFSSLSNSSLPDRSNTHRFTALLTWNSLDTSSWNSSWRSRVLTHNHPVVYTGMFEMNGIVYAIGESRHSTPSGKQKRVGKIYRYYVTVDDGRDLRETDQSVRDFFGCPRRKGHTDEPILVVGSTLTNTSLLSTSTSTSTTTSTTSTTTTTSTTSTTTQAPLRPLLNVERVNLEDTDDVLMHNTISREVPTSLGPGISGNRNLKSANVFLSSPSDSSNQIYSSVFLRNSKAKILPIGSNASTHLLTPPTAPGVSLRESDSILLTIFIGIVISACVATIILAFLTITGRKKERPRFEGARIERTIPKPTIIGLDYHPRKNSSASSTHINLMARYDSMNDINAIYSQIGKPPIGNGALGGGPQAKKKSKMKPMNPYHTVDRLNGYGVANGPPHAKSHTSASQNHPDAFSGHVNGGTTFQHFDAFE